MLIASSERIQRELNWKPKFHELDAILSSAWTWHKNFPDGYVVGKKLSDKHVQSDWGG